MNASLVSGNLSYSLLILLFMVHQRGGPLLSDEAGPGSLVWRHELLGDANSSRGATAGDSRLSGHRAFEREPFAPAPDKGLKF